MNTPEKPDTTDPAQPAPQPDPMQFPMRFPIKVMGKNEDGFVHAITEIARRFDPTFDAATVELRESSGGNYLRDRKSVV